MTITIFGGLGIYEQAIKSKCKFFITEIDDMDFEGNKRFPKLDIKLECLNDQIKEYLDNVEYSGGKFIENGIGYSFYIGMN